MSGMMPFSYFRNQIVASSEAKISIASHSLQYATLCFGGMRGYFREGKARVLRLHDHHERLMNAAKILGFDFYMAFEPFEDAIATLIKANSPTTDFYLRPFIFSDDEVLGPCMDGRNFHLAVYMMPLGVYFKKDNGLRAMVSSRTKFSDASMSTKAKASGCYLNSALATSEARRCGYDEALMVNEQGHIVEASVANLFIVYRGKVITPHIGSGPLEGITMRTISDLLRDEGIEVHTDIIDRSMMLTCDEAFITGSAAQVTYIESVDGRIIGKRRDRAEMGPVCRRASELFVKLIEMKHPRSERWVSQFSC